MKKLLKIIISTLVFITGIANAFDITTGVMDIDGKVNFIKLTGEIQPRDSTKFINALNKYSSIDNPIEMVVLDLAGGDVDETYRIVDRIIDRKMSTVVLDNAKCNSACVLIFAAGYKRLLYPKSKMGVHRARYLDKQKSQELSLGYSKGMLQSYKTLDVPDAIGLKMIETPPEKVYYLTNKEKEEFSTNKSSLLKSRTKPLKPEFIYHIKPNPVPISSIPYNPGSESAQIKELKSAAGVHYLNKDFKESEKIYSQILELDPNNVAALTQIGNIKIDTFKIGESKDYYIKSLSILRSQPMAWHNLALYYASEGDVSLTADCLVNFWSYSVVDKNAALEVVKGYLQENPTSALDVGASYAIKKIKVLTE